MLTLFATAFLLGLLFNAAPGAVFAETVRRGVRGGFSAALDVQLGSLVGDALWAILGLVGVGLLLQLEALRLPVGVAGALYLLWLARDAWRSASQDIPLEAGSGPEAGSRPSPPLPSTAWGGPALRAGVVLSVTNPQNVAYWAALGSAMGAVGVSAPQPADYAVFFAGFMVSSVLWAFICAALVARLFRGAGERWARLTYRLCALAFLALALSSVRQLVADEPGRAASRSAGSQAGLPGPNPSR